MRVILADDQPDVRSAIRLVLEERPGINIIGEVETASDLVCLAKSSNPDLILLDWELPEVRHQELITILRNLNPCLDVIALSSSPLVKGVALDAGVLEFVCKSDPPESLLKALNNCCCERPG